MRKALRSYLPSILLETHEFPLLCGTEQPEIDAMHTAAEEVLEEQFVPTASKRGLERYETIWGVLSRPTDSLEARRLRVLGRMNLQLPYTVRRLREILTRLCGPDGCTVTVVYECYQLMVRVELFARPYLEEVEKTVKRMIPANLVLDCSLNYPHFAETSAIGCLGKGYMETSLPELLYQPEELPLRTGAVFGSIAVTPVPTVK